MPSSHDRTGALVADEEQAWATALRRALDDAAWRLRITQAARAQVRAACTMAHTVQAWQRVVELALARRALRPGHAALQWHDRAGCWFGGQFGDAQAVVRSLNRARLARRQQERR